MSLCIADNYKCKPRKDLDSLTYKSNEVESVFIEIVTPKKNNIIIGCIYRHPSSMELQEFNDNYLNPLLDKITEENKEIFLVGDFNVDLMKTDIDFNTSQFFNTMTSNLMVPHIIYPTRITPHSKTLIDNIFSNSLNFSQGHSGDLTLSISDHLAQFLIIPMDYNIIPKRDTINFGKVNFILELRNINWNSIIDIGKEDPNYSFNSYEVTLGTLIDKYMPLKKLTKKEIKQQYKPWITNGIRISIKRREKYYKKFIKGKNEITKEDHHKKYKELRNQIVTLCRQSKKMHCHKFFSENANNAKNTWKGIKSIINVNSTMRSQPTSLLVNNELINEPNKIANEFNNYFSTIAINLQSKIYHHGQDFTKYLNNRNQNNFFISPTDKDEIVNIINNISLNKAVGPHSIPTNILHLIKLNISEPLSEIINLSFVKGIYFDNLKLSKTIPTFKDL